MKPFDANTFSLEPGIRLLEASAGTGKTFALAHLVLRYISEANLRLQQLLVVTYTEAAAAELRDRIGRRLQQAITALGPPEATPLLPPTDPTLAHWLHQQLNSGPEAQAELRVRLLLALEELDSSDITTIHGFCRRSLQRQALEAGLPPELQLDEADATLLRQVVHDYWQQQVLALPAHLLAGLLQHIQGPEALARLLGQLDGDPALSLDPLPPGLALEQPLAPQLERLWQQSWQRFTTLWQAQGQALEADLRAAASHWRSLGVKDTKPYSPRPTKDRCALLSSWISAQQGGGDYAATCRQELLRTYFHPGAFLKVARPLEGTEQRDPSLPQRDLLEAIAAVVEGPAEALLLHACHWGRQELARRRQQAGRLGFSQLLEAMDPGEASSTPLLEAVGQRYAVALIDEFQDTDPIQWRILSRAFRPERHRLVMVGDPKQAIYRFRGGELATYLQARSCADSAGGISGLADNYRSSQPLITALNGWMAPGLRRSGLAVPAVQAKAQREPLPLPPPAQQRPLELVWLGQDRASGDKPPSRTALEQRLPPLVAAHCLELLEQGLSPNQLCLLVSRHRQAEGLRAALERCGIASRLVSKGDVFASAGATALQRFLDALAEPARGERLRLLAASPLLGWDAARLAASSSETWSALSGALAHYAAELPRRGLLGVLAGLLDERGLAQLALSGRLLADLQQAAELVQERLHADQLGPAAAADWLRRLRHDPDRDVPEAHQLHSDVEDAAVAVVTVHRSKGLEYPVVLCPYLWQGAALGAGVSQLGSRWQPPGLAEPRLDLHLHAHWGPGHQARRQQRQAELAEQERLAYVALTRAQQRLVLFWGPALGQQGNPLHGWLFASEDLPTPEHDPYAGRSDAEWRQHLEQQIAGRELPIALRDPAEPAVHRRWQASPPARLLALGPTPKRRFDTSWGRSSYTSWTQGNHGAAPEALEEGRDTDAAAGRTDAIESTPPLEPMPSAGHGDGPLAAFPRGAQAGDCLHRILEQFDTTQPAGSQRQLLERELQRSSISADHLDAVESGMERLRHTPFGAALGDFSLSRLGLGQRLSELNFDLPLGLVRAGDLAQAFAAHPAKPISSGSPLDAATYAQRLAQLPIASRGFLTGSIDLVFCHQERWWVVDWKSNWLGERDANGQPLACGPRHYTPQAMAELMAANHYPLQAHLYLVALHRYLLWRLPNYTPERHLGGYAYVFLRGVPGPTANRPVPGMVVEQPPLPRILALHRCLGGEP